ncbi:MAG: phosphotransferase [Rhodospirillaceae bacterium]|nr:phosphotransferase [Rhodospirillaceae bacterium]
MVFPVIHSTLDPGALTDEVARRYALAPPVRCRLINRANNDFYEVLTGGPKFALRVAKADFRPPAEYAFELDLLEHLHRAGAHVPGPLRQQDGTLFFQLEAPEGVRTVALFTWLAGRPFTKALTVADAADMGEGLARLHLAGRSFHSAHTRHVDTAAYLAGHMPALLAMLRDNPDEHDFYAGAHAAVVRALNGIDPAAVPRGAVHGDYQFANVLRLADGSIGALDFDTCGIGYLAQDIFTFVWRSDMEIRDEAVNSAFIAGYERARPLTGSERACLPLFRVARDLVMAATYAILINRVGPVPGFDGDFAPFTALARRHLSDAGLAA